MTLATQVAGLISAGCSITLLTLDVRDRLRARRQKRQKDE